MTKIFVREGRDGVSDSAEIVDDHIAVDAEPLLDQGRPNHPWVVGQLQGFAANGPGKGYRELVGKIDAHAAPELLPCELEASMLGGLERDRLAEGNNAALVDLGNGEAGVGSADVGDCDLAAHACSA